MTDEQANETVVGIPAEAAAPGPQANPDVIWGTGRRKTSVARVRVKPGTGRILVNDREYREFFPTLQYQQAVTAPLRVTSVEGRYDILARIHGGGLTGQAGALSLGIARALRRMDHANEDALREHGLLTRDARMKERKKYGLHGARRGVQFSKR